MLARLSDPKSARERAHRRSSLVAKVEGSGFLYKQVRNMVGAIMRIGQGARSVVLRNCPFSQQMGSALQAVCDCGQSAWSIIAVTSALR